MRPWRFSGIAVKEVTIRAKLRQILFVFRKIYWLKILMRNAGRIRILDTNPWSSGTVQPQKGGHSMAHSRRPTVAGSFYPASPDPLRQLLQECFVASPVGPRGGTETTLNLLGGMVPHAGYVYSGGCAAHFYTLVQKDTGCVIILGVNHRGAGARAALSDAQVWETPLGDIEVERTIQERLLQRVDFLRADERAHLQEHSIEVQLPFLQTVLSRFTFVPICLRRLTAIECERLGHAVAEIYETQLALGRKTLLVASSDLSHYLSPAETERLDAIALEQVLALDPVSLLERVEENDISMCGVIPTAVLLFAAKALGASEARLLKHCHSGDAVPMREVVGYASVAIGL
jgi:AmmeMemoRadiSam system protein B